MLVRIRFDETEVGEKTVELHGELPKAGAMIEFEGKMFAVAASPTSWIFENDILIPVLHILPKTQQIPI